MTLLSNAEAPANVLVLRMDAPLMSFGGVVVDGAHPTLRFPIRSMLGGLLGNALGLDRKDFELLEQLQASFTYASRWDVEPTLLRDYQNVDMGSYKMARRAWKSDGTLAARTAGDKEAVHQTERFYWTDGVLHAALHFAQPARVRELERALRRPARPLFLGRKTCVPASPLLRCTVHAANAREALLAVPVSQADLWRRGEDGTSAVLTLEVDLPADLAAGQRAGEWFSVAAGMDMRNRVHEGTETRMRTHLDFTVERPTTA